jgi:pilus assembly protein CpaE
MLRGVIICPDEDLGIALERALSESRAVSAVRTRSYPSALDLEVMLREYDPQVVFLSLESAAQSLNLAVSLEQKAPGVPVVAVNRIPDPGLLVTMMRAGVREFLSPPFEQNSLREALSRVEGLLGRRLPEAPNAAWLYTFLPSKAGVGASTVALNTSLALSRMPDSAVLLADFDLNSGMVGFLLRLSNQYSVVDAVDRADELDEDLWSKLVSCVGRLDVLSAGRLNPGVRIDPSQLRPFLDFARLQYRVICVDLSGMMEKYSIYLMDESARIFLVCTPEVPSLHLAAEKLKFLRSLDLGERVQILLNRAQKNSAIPSQEMERILGAPVCMTLPNDYAKVHQALMSGQAVDLSSRLGRRFEELAQSLLEVPKAPVTRKRRFLEYFSLSPGEDPVRAGK